MAVLDIAALPLLPLDAGVVLPGMVVTLALESPEAAAAAQAAHSADQRVVLVPRLSAENGPDGATTGSRRYARIGTVAHLDATGELPGGTQAVVVRGLERVSIGAGVAGTGAALWVAVDPVTETGNTDRAAEMAKELRLVVDNILDRRGAGRWRDLLAGVDAAGAIADTAGYWPDLSLDRKIELLETLDIETRVSRVLGWARDILGELELKERIRTDVTEGMERTQREFLLRQQLAAIRKELGDNGDSDADSDYRSRLEALAVPDATRSAIAKEIDRLERTNEQSPEQGWIRTWLDTVFDLPWGQRSDDRLDVVAARAVLDADHSGLDEVKDRMIEHLAVRKLRADRRVAATDAEIPDSMETELPDHNDAPLGRRGDSDGMILALVGPPGVGKTSLGESVARAMGRKFVRVALGGVRDEAEIRGHRRTYVGAMAGRIVRAIREAGTMNPVILLDEVDKIGSDYRGDPSAALLEVLDPAQNHTFRDHYLDIDLDLSGVLFLATANMVDQIPGPLLDRMEIVNLDGYTEAEKVSIAADHLWARQVRQNGLEPAEVEITTDALGVIVANYTREAGVRSLERQLGKLLRKVAAGVAGGSVEVPVRVDVDDVSKWLGRPRFFSEVAERTSAPGVATGLAVTGAGGDVLFVEATSMPGEIGLTITGQLGDVMRESAEIALSYVRSHADALGLVPGAFDRRFHVHVPAGAIPKDGPSAGVTMTSALVSLLTGRPIRPEVGMTGEVTLQGKVLPIGGVKQKVLAAHRAGLTEVILPARNGPDLDDVPEVVRQQMTFHLAADVTEVLDAALA